MTVFVNHLGFVPGAAKFVVRGGPVEAAFVVRAQASGDVVFRGQLSRVASDFGVYTVGRFDALRDPGIYYVETGEDDSRIRERSHPFEIGLDVYHATVRQIVGYFTLQRCGDTDRGWLGRPCHLDDGMRGDTGEHRDVEGGWHDACDLRKWVDATLYGLLGLSQVQQVLDPEWAVEAGGNAILDELRWGNRYFLKMQDPAGYVMNFVGGDYFVHADNNRWTDNISDGQDDRVIDVRACTVNAQWLFVMSQAAIASLAAAEDPVYAEECGQAALRCLAWLLETGLSRSAGEFGVAILALLALHRWRPDGGCLAQAVAQAERLLALQVTRQLDYRTPVGGFFWERRDPEQAPDSLEPYKAIWYGCWPLTGLSMLLEAAPDHDQAPAWRAGIRRLCEQYLVPMAQRGAFGTIPYGLYRARPQGGRELGSLWYRWFMEAGPVWYVGINAHLASIGVGLAKAARLLGEPEWGALAQRQLDWIVGANPFDASTVVGAGYNTPQHMFGLGYDPPTPYLPGAVMNGISGNDADEPQLRPGSWQDTEYWTPMVAYTMWLMAELSRE